MSQHGSAALLHLEGGAPQKVFREDVDVDHCVAALRGRRVHNELEHLLKHRVGPLLQLHLQMGGSHSKEMAAVSQCRDGTNSRQRKRA